jgi:hypothetical protein
MIMEKSGAKAEFGIIDVLAPGDAPTVLAISGDGSLT